MLKNLQNILPHTGWFDSQDNSGIIQRIKQSANRSNRSDSKPMPPGIGVLSKDHKLRPSAGRCSLATFSSSSFRRLISLLQA